MGLVYKEIDRHEVVNILKQKGYGEMGMRRYALALNKPTGEFFQSGSEKRVFAGGVSHDQLTAILRFSNSPEEAARRVEQTALGHEILPPEGPTVSAAPENGLSLEMAEKLIENRVAAEVAKCILPMQSEMTAMARNISVALDLIAKLSEPRKKPGRPKGSKNKTKETSEAPAAQQA